MLKAIARPAVATQMLEYAKSYPAAFFDEGFYLLANPDVGTSDLDPFLHFIFHGLAEGRCPSRLVSFEHLRFLAAQGHPHIQSVPKTSDALADLLESWPCDSLFGPSVRMCPAWLCLQTGMGRECTLLDLLGTVIPAGSFAWHPCALPYDVPVPMNVLTLLSRLKDTDFKALSLLDLGDYTANHRDMVQLGYTAEQAFEHLWSFGPFENRLKYLGNRRPTDVPMERVFLTQCATVYRHYFAEHGVLLQGNTTALKARNTRHLDPDGPVFNALASVLDQSHPATVTSLDLGTLDDLRDLVQGNDTVIVPDRLPAPSPAVLRRVGSCCITDQQLLSGAHKAGTRRVVYGVNIGGYDALPVPPQMDDCSYFLITDAAEVPEDTPWTIVSPTLAETDVKRQCLWYKTHPHHLFPQAEFVTWIDGNIEARSQSGLVLTSHEALSEVATFAHPDRDCVYDEADAIMKAKLDTPKTIDRAIAAMRHEGLPRNYGLFETNVLFSRTRDMGVRAFFDTWWRHIFLGSRRDQMSFTFAAWQAGVDVSCLDGRSCAKNSRFFSKRPHTRKTGRMV